MPRKARIDAPGALQHIIIRGIEQQSIFNDTQDYQNFIERLGSILTDTSTPCYAWTQMTNHVHLLLRTGHAPLSTVMQRLLTGYAQHTIVVINVTAICFRIDTNLFCAKKIFICSSWFDTFI